MRGAVVFFALVGGIGTFGAVGLLIEPAETPQLVP